MSQSQKIILKTKNPYPLHKPFDSPHPSPPSPPPPSPFPSTPLPTLKSLIVSLGNNNQYLRQQIQQAHKDVRVAQRRILSWNLPTIYDRLIQNPDPNFETNALQLKPTCLKIELSYLQSQLKQIETQMSKDKRGREDRREEWVEAMVRMLGFVWGQDREGVKGVREEIEGKLGRLGKLIAYKRETNVYLRKQLQKISSELKETTVVQQSQIEELRGRLRELEVAHQNNVNQLRQSYKIVRNQNQDYQLQTQRILERFVSKKIDLNSQIQQITDKIQKQLGYSMNVEFDYLHDLGTLRNF